MNKKKGTKLLIGILTYRRELYLENLLNKIKNQKFTGIKKPKIEILIADNDPKKGAHPIYKDFKKELNITYKQVIPKGISYGRNTVLNYAKDNSDLLVFIDDDEFPSQEWLNELLITRKKYGADIVTGPIVPVFNKNAPSWIHPNFYINKKKYFNGQKLNSAATNNVLIDINKIKDEKIKFDERLALSGGSDGLFFSILFNKGYSIYWAKKAIVFEEIPEKRTTFRWIAQRAFRMGNGYIFRLKYIHASLNKISFELLKSICRIAAGTLLILPSLFIGKTKVIEKVSLALKGLGFISGLIGIKYYEYK